MKISQDEIALLFPDGFPVELMKVLFPEKSEPLTTDELRFLMGAVAFQQANDRQYLIGDQTAARVFKAAGLTNMSDLQAVMDAVERALISDGVPVAWYWKGPRGGFLADDKKPSWPSTPLYEQAGVKIKPLEWKRGDYISSAKSVDTLAFTAQLIGDGDDGWMLRSYLTNETKRTRHPTREAAEQAAQALHNSEVAKYLQG